MNQVVCVTEKEYYKAEAVFAGEAEFKCIPASLEEAVLAKTLIDNKAFAAVLGVDKYCDQLYSALPQGGIIARFGVGHDGVDKARATEAGIIATNTPEVLDDSVAEHTVWLMGALAREIAFHDANMKANKWQPSNGSELNGKTMLLVGCGKIGCKAAKIASFGFGMNVIGYDIAKLDAGQMKREWGINTVVSSLDKVLADADFVSIHLPANEATKHFVNKELLSKMKSTAFLVNTARGSIVDESALYDAIESGKIAGAGLDVFENEPFALVDSAKDLRKLEKVVLTPHVASSTNEACKRMAKRVLCNIKACFEKRYDQLDILNPEVLTGL